MILKGEEHSFSFNVGVDGRTWDIYVSKDGSSYTAITGTCEPLTMGGYVIHASADDMDADVVNFLVIENNNPFLETGNPLKYEAFITTDNPLIENGDGTIVWRYIMYTDQSMTIPLEGCIIKMTRDRAGFYNLGEQTTDTLGETSWLVDAGVTYYLWRRMPGYAFVNPDIITIDIEALSISSSGRYK